MKYIYEPPQIKGMSITIEQREAFAQLIATAVQDAYEAGLHQGYNDGYSDGEHSGSSYDYDEGYAAAIAAHNIEE